MVIRKNFVKQFNFIPFSINNKRYLNFTKQLWTKNQFFVKSDNVSLIQIQNYFFILNDHFFNYHLFNIEFKRSNFNQFCLLNFIKLRVEMLFFLKFTLFIWFFNVFNFNYKNYCKFIYFTKLIESKSLFSYSINYI